MATILIVDDEQNILVTLSRALKMEGYQTQTAGTGNLGLEKLQSEPVDLVLLDVKLPDTDGLDVLRQIIESHPGLPVIMMSGHATVEIAVRAVRMGAVDFLEKPLSTNKVLTTTSSALAIGTLARNRKSLPSPDSLKTEMIGKSPALRLVLEQIQLVAPSNGRVLITGENGTGKELVARAIHDNSHRSQCPFIKVNCAAVPHELIESELFGHEKGSFTGASHQRKGKFEQADKGTLFLDEIGDMPKAMQAKLLRVLQEGELERVGSSETLHVDVRVLSATNQDLVRAIALGLFREDLYYRINVIPIHVPPLRERKEDIASLVNHFLAQACEQNNRRQKTFSQAALEHLLNYDFLGNVRELKNSIERLVILVQADDIQENDVKRWLGLGPPSVADEETESSFYRPDRTLRELLNQAERDIILRALQDNQSHVTNAAKQLGLERSHLYKKMKALGIK